MQELAAVAICIMIGFFTLVLFGFGGAAYLYVNSTRSSSRTTRKTTPTTRSRKPTSTPTPTNIHVHNHSQSVVHQEHRVNPLVPIPVPVERPISIGRIEPVEPFIAKDQSKQNASLKSKATNSTPKATNYKPKATNPIPKATNYKPKAESKTTELALLEKMVSILESIPDRINKENYLAMEKLVSRFNAQPAVCLPSAVQHEEPTKTSTKIEENTEKNELKAGDIIVEPNIVDSDSTNQSVNAQVQTDQKPKND
ncbi:putative ORFan [Tupanvirus deep ocean]|uniref:ORFan n=2 Tax=Tupanvirus TaxID=2094720 RepID=A0AC62A9K6_9VIRU|nr:putative ORFan [Tupanvirus deep ocean]QKU34456.1 putative ORFan [Tupanvirus deep ocean]